jgi:hypothetical protein
MCGYSFDRPRQANGSVRLDPDGEEFHADPVLVAS